MSKDVGCDTLWIVDGASVVQLGIILGVPLRDRACLLLDDIAGSEATKQLPPMSHVFSSLAAALSILTLSLSLLAGSNGWPGVYPIFSAYCGKWFTPYGELKHS